MLGAASRMVTFYFAICLGGALFINGRLTSLNPDIKNERKL